MLVFRPLLLIALALSQLSVGAAPAAAASPIRVGVGDQSAAMFTDPSWKALGLKTTRYFFPWNGMDDAYQRDRARTFVEAAKASGVSVLFHLSTDNYVAAKAKLPTVAQYRAQLRRIVPYFRARGVREWGVWNEANHITQPTYRSPRQAALFFREMYQVVPQGDRIVALDVLDQAGVDRYITGFFTTLSPIYRGRAKILGIHNYSDVNRTRAPMTGLMIRTARRQNPRLRFWFTETGALVEFGRGFRCSTGRAAVRLPKVFTIAKQFRGQGVDRILLYNWFGPGCGNARFDAGLVNAKGTPRAAYRTLQRLLPDFSR